MLAQLSGGEVAGWVGGAAGLVTAVASAAILIIRERHKGRQEAEATAVSHLSGIVDRQEKQIERLQVHAGELARELDETADEAGRCHDDYSDLYGHLQLTADFARRMSACCRRLGEDPGEPPAVPPRRPRADRGAVEARRRGLAQNTALLTQPPGGSP